MPKQMLKQTFLFCLSLAATLSLAAAASPVAPASRPKLVLAIAIDQFRYDYLTRYRGEYTGGLARMLTRGAVFTDANYEHAPTVTAVGHSTFLSGALPSVSGIAGNEWFDRTAGKVVSSVSDDSVQLLGGSSEAGASPRRMLVDTVGDELKIATGGKSHVIGVSLKDRSAILPAGHMADGAFWLDAKTGSILSSTYYFADLPAWVKDLNGSKPADKYAGVEWLGHTLGKAGDEGFYGALPATPFGNEIVELISERAVISEKLGKHAATDLLAVSFSSNDYVGHAYGPDSPEAHDTAVRTDKLFDKFFRFLESQVGMQNVLVVMTADHGVAPLPELTAERKIGGGRMPARAVQDAVQAALDQKFGKAKWIANAGGEAIYLDRELISQKKHDRAEVQRVAADAARAVPHVARVFTGEELAEGGAMGDPVARRVQNGYNAVRGGDLVIILEPYWLYGAKGTTHGTPYNYDTHVPIIFMGPGIKAGRYNKQAKPNDIAPTLATMLDVEIPSGSSGRVLDEMLTAR
jgi:predicted AlkP superfamily pyrophosphatase or phosphodiesterase